LTWFDLNDWKTTVVKFESSFGSFLAQILEILAIKTHFAPFALISLGGLLSWVQLPVRVTKDIVETYQLCNPSFQHSESLNPKRYLTNPSVPEFNNGCDNENHDLILYYGCVLVNENSTRR
jgi:hypothetical protein